MAIIPARGGSKRIPRKNIRPFLGTPLISRTIETLLNTDAIDRIVVSTDDDEVADVALAAGAEVPFRRPDDLADDHATTQAVIEHAIEALEEADGAPLDLVCVIYPAAVFVSPADLTAARDLLIEGNRDYVFTGTTFPFPIQRAIRMLDDGGCDMFQPEHRQTRSQDLEPAYHDAGQFYWGTRDAWVESRPVFAPDSSVFLLSRHLVQDIDTEEDWERAELLFRMLHQS